MGRASQWLNTVTVSLVVGLALPSAAGAAGFWAMDRGPSNYGRGGANIAAPRDPIAVYTNPAALAGLRGLQLSLDANMVMDARRFTRTPPTNQDGQKLPGFPEEYEKVKGGSQPWPPSPGFFVAYNGGEIGLGAFTLGGGIFGPPRADRVWPREGPQRYGEIESHNLQIQYALSAAYELPWYRLRLGVTGMMISQIIDTALMLNADLDELFGSPPFGENQSYDVFVQADATDHAIPCGVFGLSLAPMDWLVVAVSYQLPYDVTAKGDATIELAEGFAAANAKVQGKRIDVLIKMPPILRAAIKYTDPDDSFDVELAYVMEGWSRNDVVVFAPKDIVLDINHGASRTKIENVAVDSQWQNSHSVRLGGSYVLIPELLRMRAGIYYESASNAAERTSPASMDLDKLGGTLGGRLELPLGIWLELAAGYSHWFRREITKSEMRLANPLIEGADKVEKHPIATGVYNNRQIIVMAGVGVRFDI